MPDKLFVQRQGQDSALDFRDIIVTVRPHMLSPFVEEWLAVVSTFILFSSQWLCSMTGFCIDTLR